MYARGGFLVKTALMDREFAPVQAECPQLPINCTAANEHVPEPERAARLVKERCRGTENTLPFDGLPKLMVIELLHFVVLWLNNFPVKLGISTKYSPRELICRHKLNAKQHCQTPFGTYCEVHDEPSPLNGMTPRTHPAICMGPTGNFQGTYKFMCLTTGKKLHRRKWDEIPMPRSVIKKVNRMAKRDKTKAKLTFCNQNNEPFDFNNGEYDEQPEQLVEPAPSPYPGIPAELPGVDLEENHVEGNTPAVFESESDVQGQLVAAAAAANAGLLGPAQDDRGAHRAKAEDHEIGKLLEDDDWIIDIQDGLPYQL
jgi:hypothetical protein